MAETLFFAPSYADHDSQGKALESLNLTPLIDVVFLLLIFFLVATRFAQEDRELPVQLLSCERAADDHGAKRARCACRSPRRLHGKWQKVDLPGLEKILRQAVADNPIGQVVIIRADKSAEVQPVVTIMDLCTLLKVPATSLQRSPNRNHELPIPNNATSLLLLDTAYFLLGGLVLFLVLTLLPLDDPNPLRNAWTYILGVPTTLIALSMLTHVLSNEIVERSLQIGLLASVALHLALLLGARHWLLFSGVGSLDSMVQQETVQTAERRPPVYYQPSPTKALDQRPDYLKPVPIEAPPLETTLNEKQETAEHAPLELKTPQEALESKLVDGAVPLERKFELVSEPEIDSETKEWSRPDSSLGSISPSIPIDVPVLRTPEKVVEQSIAPKPLAADQKANPNTTPSASDLKLPMEEKRSLPFPAATPRPSIAPRSLDREIAERMQQMESIPASSREEAGRPRSDSRAAAEIASNASPVPVPEVSSTQGASSERLDAAGPRDTDLRNPKTNRGQKRPQ